MVKDCKMRIKKQKQKNVRYRAPLLHPIHTPSLKHVHASFKPRLCLVQNQMAYHSKNHKKGFGHELSMCMSCMFFVVSCIHLYLQIQLMFVLKATLHTMIINLMTSDPEKYSDSESEGQQENIPETHEEMSDWERYESLCREAWPIVS